jgi:hypothetical protein
MDRMVAPVSRKVVRGTTDALEAMAYRDGRSSEPEGKEDDAMEAESELNKPAEDDTTSIFRFSQVPDEPEGNTRDSMNFSKFLTLIVGL